MSQDLTITLPHPPAVLRPNASCVWQAKLSPKRKARAAAMTATARALQDADAEHTLCGLVPTGYTIRWFYWLGAGPDADNALGSCKAYLDGIAQHLRINDRTLRCCGIERIKERRADLDIVIHYENPEALLPLWKPAAAEGSGVAREGGEA